MQFDEFLHRVRTGLFEDGNRVSIVEHEKLLNAYTKLEAKYDKLKKEADEVGCWSLFALRCSHHPCSGKSLLNMIVVCRIKPPLRR